MNELYFNSQNSFIHFDYKKTKDDYYLIALLKDNKLSSGFIKQEDLPFDNFINGKFGEIYGTT